MKVVVEVKLANYMNLGMAKINSMFNEAYFGVEITELENDNWRIEFSNVIIRGKRHVIGFMSTQGIEYFYSDVKQDPKTEIRIMKIKRENLRATVEDWFNDGYSSICIEGADGILYFFNKELLLTIL